MSCSATMHLYTSWSSGQNSAEQTAKAKNGILQSMQENKMMKNGNCVGLKYLSKTLKYLLRAKTFQKKKMGDF